MKNFSLAIRSYWNYRMKDFTFPSGFVLVKG
jgi:hypothetical protein